MEYPTYHGDRTIESLTLQQYHQLIFTPLGILLSYSVHSSNQLHRVSGLSQMFRPMRMILHAIYVLRVIALFQAVEGLRRDAEVTASETSVVIMGVIVIKPFQPLFRFPG